MCPIVFDARLLGGDADHHLEGRARRVNAGDRLVEERLLFVSIVGVERRLADAVDEEVRIEARRRRHHQQVAGDRCP